MNKCDFVFINFISVLITKI